jgi:RNA 2',3'-cyclic 3'-phosphodiesterase
LKSADEARNREGSLHEKDVNRDGYAMTAGQTSGPNDDKDAGSHSAGRLFIGIPVDQRVREGLEQFLAPVEIPGRRVPPDKWHLTLRFLGDTSQDALHRLCGRLRATAFGASFEIAFDALGAFPRPARASVLWLGVSDGADRLVALAAKCEAAVRHAGFAAESRSFSSHLTLSRLQPPRDVRPLVESVPAFRERMAVNDVTLFRSHLGRGPTGYEVVETFSLSEETSRD